MTAPPVDRDLLDFALAVARRGGDLAAGQFFAADTRTSLKPDGTEVTGADLAVEDLIRAEPRLPAARRRRARPLTDRRLSVAALTLAACLLTR